MIAPRWRVQWNRRRRKCCGCMAPIATSSTQPGPQHFTHGLVLGWNSPQNFRTTLPVGQRNVAAYSALSFRASQTLDPLNPLDTPRTLRVTLRTTGGVESNVGFDISSLQSVPYPYEYNGGKTVLGTIRIPLADFRKGNGAFPLEADIVSCSEFGTRVCCGWARGWCGSLVPAVRLPDQPAGRRRHAPSICLKITTCPA